MKIRIRWILLILAVFLLLSLVWFSFSADATITALRNVIHYQVVELFGGPSMLTGEPPGAFSGTIRDNKGQPLAGAKVLVASPLGHTYTAETAADGNYYISGIPSDEFDGTLVLGGMSDGFAFRHDVEAGTAHTRPPFDQALLALGFPNNSPELYFKYYV